MTQLEFDLAGLGLRLEPTLAMRRGEQAVYQHSYCGTVVVRSSLGTRPVLGPCPACTEEHAGDAWWLQQIGRDGLAGLHLVEPGSPGADASSVGGEA